MRAVAATVALLAASALAGPAPALAAGPALSFQPQLGLPAGSVNMVGAAPEEAPAAAGGGEAPGAFWATGVVGHVPASVGEQNVHDTTVLLRHGQQGSWQIVPVLGAKGEALPFTGTPGVTPRGGLALLASRTIPKTPPTPPVVVQSVVVRDPGGAFVEAAPPPTKPSKGVEAVLEPGETLFGAAGGEGAPLLAAIDDPAHTGALIVPAGLSTTRPGVVHYDGARWTREPLCVAYTKGVCAFELSEGAKIGVLAIAASSAGNAWLLAHAGTAYPLLLFKRQPLPGGGAVWVLSQPASFDLPGSDTIAPRGNGQQLTVSSQGVWVDERLTNPNAEEGASAEGESADISLLVSASVPEKLLGTWCYPQAACGPHAGSLAAPLPEGYRSFAWPGAGAGTRVIAGLEHGALLRFGGAGDFEYVVGGGGNPSGDAAFASPEDGWIAATASAGANSAQIERVTPTASTSAPSSGLTPWPLPFRRPLTAIVAQPGSAPGDPTAQALAVGDQGQIARYVPGQGWTPEFLYTASGEVARPRLRGVAWPEPGRAYAVGDEGAMWVWRAETGLWEPDPARPLSFHANLTAIAFSPTDPALGYAVGKQGALLAYDKTWTQQQLPAGLEQANITSIAFAGAQALATYRMVSEGVEVGGLLVKEPGEGWKIDTGAQTLLAGLSNPSATVLSKVAGLPDGGAVAAGPGIVIERDAPGDSWRFSTLPLPEAQNIAALAAIREGGQVRALVSADLDGLSNPNSSTDFLLNIDEVPAPGFGQPPPLVGPDPLPVSGYLLRETAGGWEDVERQAYPESLSIPNSDLPDWPDAVLALDVTPDGSQGWAVGGQTGGIVENSQIGGSQLLSQSAAALRLGAGPAPPQTPSAPLSGAAGQATFALGGDAQCAAACSDFAADGLGPDAWLSGAVARAAQVQGLRAFLYSGSHVAEGVGRSLPSGAFARELGGYRRDLEDGGGPPVYAAASPSDAGPEGTMAPFAAALGPDAPAGTVPPGTPAPPTGSAAYAFESTGSGGPVRAIVLDYSASELAAGELEWLAAQLQSAAAAHVPAIVLGSADVVEPTAPNHAQDGAAVEQTLLQYHASAYLFDSPGENRAETIGSGPGAIPAYGSGTLGYVPPPPVPTEFLGASGFLLVNVDVARRDLATNLAPVSATLIPSIAQLGVDATDGTLLRRSQVALFQGLARRPAGGLELAGAGSSATQTAPEPYAPVPQTCIGQRCAQFIAPSYSFRSSNPDIGNFVEQNPSIENPRAVLQGPDGRPIADPHSGLFCAYNSGTTTVTLETGGLSYAEQVTVQGGSVEQPCGTVPLINPPAAAVAASAAVSPLPPTAPPAAAPTPLAVVPPPPPAPAAAPAPPPPPPAPAVAPAPLPPFFPQPIPPVAVVAIPLPPPPPLARPIPPSGTSPVFSSSFAPEEEKEEEEAVESARNAMAAYHPDDPNIPPVAPLALLVLAAGAGALIRRSGSRGRRLRQTPALARARGGRARW